MREVIACVLPQCTCNAANKFIVPLRTHSCERQRERLAAEGVPFTAGGRVDLRAARLPEPPD